MNLRIEPGALRGTVSPPPSKSMMQRLCAGALLHRGTTLIRNPGVSDDDRAALRIIRQLGARILSQTGDAIEIHSEGISPAPATIDCGESGLSARLFTPIAATSGHPVRIEGRGSLPGRPMQEFAQILPQLGIDLPGFTGFIPMTVSGTFRAADLTLDGSQSSQFLSGILFALAFGDRPATVTVERLTSRPYIDLTLQVLEQFGCAVTHEDYRRFRVAPYAQTGGRVEATVEADWSGAAAWVVAGALSGEVSLRHLDPRSTQADRQVVRIAEDAGASVGWVNDTLTVGPGALRAFEADLNQCPDLFPVVSVLAAACAGTSVLRGLGRLAHKESDRAARIRELLDALRVPYSVEGDALRVTGVSSFPGASLSSHHDHRMAMAAALCALRATGPIGIADAGAVSKSYPGFWEDWEQLFRSEERSAGNEF